MNYRRAGVLGLLLMVGIGGGIYFWNPMGVKHPTAREVFRDPKVVDLAEALERTNLEKATQLLHEGVDPNAVGKDGITLPLWTMFVENKVSFKWLFENGANPNLIPTLDRGILHWTAGANDPDWLEMLLQHKADPNLKRKDGILTHTPLSQAILNYRRKNLELLIKAGADVNYQLPEEDGASTPAIDAADSGWFEGVYVLLKAGADYRPKTKGGGYDVTYSVLSRSLKPGSESAMWRDKVVRLLQDRGADLEPARKRIQEEEQQDRKDRPWVYTRGK